MKYQTKSSASFTQVFNRVRSLSNRHCRGAQQKFFFEGIRNFIAACDAKVPLDTIILCEILLKSGLVEKLTRHLGASGVQRVRVTPEQFRAISATARASGIAAISRQPWTPLKNAQADRGIGWLVVEQIRSAGNLGTIIRTAEACGMGGIIFIGPACDPFDPCIVRASMGGIFSLQMVRTNARDFCQWAAIHRVTIVGLSPGAPPMWDALPNDRPIALLLGEERHGLTGVSRGLCQTMIGLPMTGRADSLNVAVAGGIVMYELMRRSVKASSSV